MSERGSFNNKLAKLATNELDVKHTSESLGSKVGEGKRIDSSWERGVLSMVRKG